MRTVNLLILIVTFQPLCSQTSYYVSPGGNNTGSGSLGQPWQTVQYGADQLTPGDTLNVMAGTYNELVSVHVSGSSSGKVVIKNYPAQSPVIDGTRLSGQTAMIEITNHSYITVEGLEIANNIRNDAQGISVNGNCQNITITNCKIHDIHFSSNPNDSVSAGTNAQGIIVYGTDALNAIKYLTVSGNEVYNCRLGYSEGLAVNGNVDGFTVSGNYVHSLSNIGIDIAGHEGTCSDSLLDQARNGVVEKNIAHDCISPYATSGGLYVDGGKNITLQNNVSYHNGYGLEIGCEHPGKSADSVVARNNILYNNQAAGVAFGGYDYPVNSGKITGCVLSNNTVFKDDYSYSGSGEMAIGYTENSHIFDNLFYASEQNILFSATVASVNMHLNYNLYYTAADTGSFNWPGITYNGFAAYRVASGEDLNSLFADPLLADTNIFAPDLHIRASSPCIDAGDPTYQPVQEYDMDSQNRVYNGRIDIGAYEYHGVLSIENIADDMEIVLYPNPCRGLLCIKGRDIYAATIYTSTGQYIMEGETDGERKIFFDLSNMTSGAYSLHILTRRGQVTKKLVHFTR